MNTDNVEACIYATQRCLANRVATMEASQWYATILTRTLAYLLTLAVEACALYLRTNNLKNDKTRTHIYRKSQKIVLRNRMRAVKH